MDKWTEGEMVVQEKRRKKLSWWELYHLWGGICLNTYVNVSGLSEFALGVAVDHLQITRFTYAAYAGGLVFGSIMLGHYLSKSLISTIDQSPIPHKAKIALKIVLPIIYLLAASLLASITAPIFTKSAR